MTFVGIDHSLTAPGIARIDPSGPKVRTIRTGKLRGMERQSVIIDAVLKACEPVGQTMVAIEGHSYGHNQQGSRERTELVGVIKWELSRRGIPWTQDIPPNVLKAYVSGNGQADKDDMVEAVRAQGVNVLDDNAADAYGLALIIHDTYRFAAKGVKPKTIYRYEKVLELEQWMREHIQGGAILDGG